MDIEKKQEIKDNVFYNVSFFHNDQKILLLYQKIERICGAIFLVSRFFDDAQILKITLQESALMSLKAGTEFVADSTVSVQKLKNVSINLTSLYAHLDSAFWSGLLSQMNCSVIQKEIRNTVSVASELEEKYRELANPKNSFLSLLEVKDIQKDTLRDILKDNVKDIQDKRQVQKRPVNSSQHDDRTEKIKSILRDFKERTVKDIATLFPDVSEKTIQREINRLIGLGIVKRIGDRRWSTYTLA